MGIYSMTGYGRAEAAGEQYQLTVEIKSVNHRFRDIRVKMGSVLLRDEIKIKKAVEAEFKRGSFDMFVSYRKKQDRDQFDDLDNDKIKAFLKSMKGISNISGVPLEMRSVDFLRSEFIQDKESEKYEELSKLVWEALPKAIEALKKMRQEEGEKLVEVLNGHMTAYKDVFKTVTENAKGYEESVKEKLNKRFEEYKQKLEVDQPRYLQEVVFYLEKLDVQEEISRIEIHLSKLEELLKGGGEVGRKIDFLIQELGRETNTIGSKSGLPEISDAVVNMKVHLEKIREQGYNFE